MALDWCPLQPFGAQVLGDLAAPLSSSDEDLLRSLLRDHGLILARGQALSMERQRELCSLFGPILDRDGETGIMSNEAGGYSASELNWHADAAYTPYPFDALALHALDVVDSASSTAFVSAEAGWASLPADLRAQLAGRDQAMVSPHYTRLAQYTCDTRDPPAMKRGIMPAVHLNPRTGREVLWTSAMQTERLQGLDWEVSRDLLHAVYAHLYAEERVLEHRWCTGDLIVWDNIALQHRRGSVAKVGKRVLQRVIVGTQGVAPHVSG